NLLRLSSYLSKRRLGVLRDTILWRPLTFRLLIEALSMDMPFELALQLAQLQQTPPNWKYLEQSMLAALRAILCFPRMGRQSSYSQEARFLEMQTQWSWS